MVLQNILLNYSTVYQVLDKYSTTTTITKYADIKLMIKDLWKFLGYNCIDESKGKGLIDVYWNLGEEENSAKTIDKGKTKIQHEGQ